MEKNKTGKYFKYAIGEILLVAKGLLIALQINSWNEGRKNRQLEKEYLHGILKDLEEDIITYKRKIENDTLHLNYATGLQKAFRDKNIRSDRTLSLRQFLIPLVTTNLSVLEPYSKTWYHPGTSI